jgi:hypothetical protein
MVTFLCVVAMALPVSGEPSRVELQLSPQFRAIQYLNDPLRSTIGGDVSVGVTVFLKRVVDDDAAPSLQPFLQRVGLFRAGISGGGTTTTESALRTPMGIAVPGGSQSSLTRADLFAAASGYLGGWAYLAGSLRFAIVGDQRRQLSLHPELSLGVRWRQLLVYAGWGVTSYWLPSSSGFVSFWGGAFAGAQGVVRRFVELGVRIDVLDRGAEVEGSATFWLLRRLGLGISVYGGHGGLNDLAGFEVEATLWIVPRAALSLGYMPEWRRTTESIPGVVAGTGGGPLPESVDHRLWLSVVWRLPVGAANPD